MRNDLKVKMWCLAVCAAIANVVEILFHPIDLCLEFVFSDALIVGNVQKQSACTHAIVKHSFAF